MGVQFINHQAITTGGDYWINLPESADAFMDQSGITQNTATITAKHDIRKSGSQVKEIAPKTFPVLSRYQRWKEEQTLLIDSSRYIDPVSANNYFQPEIKIDDINLSGTERHFSQNDWLILVLLLALSIFASIRSSYAKYLGTLIKSIFYYPAAIKMYNEKNYPLIHGAYRLEIYFYIIASAFIFQASGIFSNGFGIKKFLLFFICFGLVLIYFFLKKMIYGLIGFISGGTQEFSEIQFNLANYYRVLGLLLFPFVALLGFLPMEDPQNLTIAGVGLMVVFYLLFLLRSGKILLRNRVPIHYLFLYLCTLEILPLVLIGKLVLV